MKLIYHKLEVIKLLQLQLPTDCTHVDLFLHAGRRFQRLQTVIHLQVQLIGAQHFGLLGQRVQNGTANETVLYYSITAFYLFTTSATTHNMLIPLGGTPPSTLI